MRSVSHITVALSMVLLAYAYTSTTRAAADKAIPIEVPARTMTVDFETEIVPILRANCVACHTGKKTEGGLVLDSLKAILKGGENGPAVVPSKSADSLLLKVASHQQERFMPPTKNTVGAKTLTPGELGLIKLWIDQGATGGGPAARVVQFQPLPKGFQPIFATAITPDNQFAICSRGNRIDVYHLPSASHVTSLVDPQLNSLAGAHQDLVRSLAVDPTGNYVASGSFNEVKLWRRPGVSRVAEWAHDEAVRCVAISADGKWAATGDEKGTVRVWERGSGKTLASIAAHKEAVTGLAFTPDGATLYSSSLDRSLRVWKRNDGSAIGKVETDSPIQALALLGRGESLAIGCDDGSIGIWEVKTLGSAKEARRVIAAHDQAIAAMAVDPANRQNLVSAADRLVRVWDSTTGKQLREIKNDIPVMALAVRSDGRRIAVGGKEGATIWDAETDTAVTRIQGDPSLARKVAKIDAEVASAKTAVSFAQQDLNGYEGLIERTKRLTADGKKLEDELAKAKKTRDEKKAAVEKAMGDGKVAPADEKTKGDSKAAMAAEKAAKEAEEAVALSETVVERSKASIERANERLAATQKALAEHEAAVKRYEQAKTAAVAAAKEARPAMPSLAFSADGSRLAVGFESGALHIYSAENGTALDSREEHNGAIHAMAFGLNDTFLTCGADRRVIVWSAPDCWRLERTIGGEKQSRLSLAERVLALNFSPDGKVLATGSGVPARSGELKLWNVANGQLLREFKDAHTDTVFSVRFSPDGLLLASASADRMVKLFDLASGECRQTLSGHSAHVLGVSWKRDGTVLATCGADNVIKVWSVETGNLARTLKGGNYDRGTYKREVTSVAFVSDTEAILAASGDGTVRMHRTGHENDVVKFAGSEGYQYAVAVSPDGRTLVAGGSDGVLRVWTDRDPKLKHSLRE